MKKEGVEKRAQSIYRYRTDSWTEIEQQLHHLIKRKLRVT